MANPAEIIQEIVDRRLARQELYSRICLVTDIDEAERTCTCDPIDDPDSKIFNVKFQSVINSTLGIFIKPKLNTHVIVTFINQNAGFISLVGAIDKIFINCDSVIFNDGGNGGLINIEKLITQVGKNTAVLKEMQSVFSNWAPLPNDGGAALKALVTPLVSLPRADLSDIEDTKIKH